MPSPVDGSIWGSVPRQSRRGRAARARLEPARDGAGRGLQRAAARLRRARRDIDSKASSGCRWRAATSAASIDASAKARSTDRRRPAITAPRAGRSTSIPGPGLRGHRREQRRVELLHLGRSAQHVRARRGRADVDRQSERRADRAQGRQDGRAARAVSARLLRQGLRRPHRRSERRAGRAAACGRPTATARRG